MSRLVRASVVLTSAMLAVPLWGVPTAAADSTVLVPQNAGYFNADGIRKPDESPAAPPNVTSGQADGVAPEHLAVAARTGQENKVSFLLFDLFDLGLDVTVSKAVLTLPVAPDGNGNVNLSPAPEKVVACPAGEGGFIGDDGTSIQDAPDRLCDVTAVKAVATADGAAYAFDITPIAQSWVTDVNNGVALTSAPDARSTAFQRVFKPASEAKLALTFTSAEATGEDVTVDVPVSSPDTGTSFDSGSGSTDLGTSFDSGSFSSPDSGLGSLSEPVLSADVPVALSEDDAPVEPELAAPSAATVPVSNMTSAPLTPTPAFWIGLLLAASALGLLSLIMGDPRVPTASSTSQSRLTQALQARQRGGAGRQGGTRPALSL